MNYKVVSTSSFKKTLKLMRKRGKKLEKLKYVVDTLACGKELEPRYRDHQLIDNSRFKDCRECHIEPDWLLVYRFNNKELILVLVETGTHSDLF